jgi:hypothetical protein
MTGIPLRLKGNGGAERGRRLPGYFVGESENAPGIRGSRLAEDGLFGKDITAMQVREMPGFLSVEIVAVLDSPSGTACLLAKHVNQVEEEMTGQAENAQHQDGSQYIVEAAAANLIHAARGPDRA